MLFKYGNCTRLLKIKKQAENRLFLQIKSGRILDILRVFLIKHYSTTLVGYEMIIANSYPTLTRGIIVNYPRHSCWFGGGKVRLNSEVSE